MAKKGLSKNERLEALSGREDGFTVGERGGKLRDGERMGVVTENRYEGHRVR